jgi:O-antigen/teichoic acid export membrane protein
MQSPGRGTLSGNSILNFGTQVYSVLVAFASLPFIVHGLGDERFGLLTLLWLFVGYFSVIDFGAGQAALRFLSVAVAEHDTERVVRTFRVTLRISLTIGVLSALIATAVSFTDALSLLKLDDALRPELVSGLRLLAIGLPAQLLQVSLKSIPMAFNRYGLNSLLQVVSVSVQWIGGAIIAVSGGGLMGVLLLTVASRYVIAIGYVAAGFFLIPEARSHSRDLGWEEFRPFLSYGGWAAVPQLMAPAFTFVERLVVGSVLSVAWVAYFAVPSDTVARFLIFPLSLVNAAFPVFSGGWALEEGKSRVRGVYARSLKLVLLGIIPLALVLGVFSREILTVWLKSAYAAKSTVPLMIMSAGLVFNVVAQIPVTFLMAVGRPDLPAKIGIVQAPLYVGLLLFLTAEWGIVGTAAAWSVRVTIEALVLLWLAWNVMGKSGAPAYRWVVPVACTAAGTAALFILMHTVMHLDVMLVVGIGLVLAGYCCAIWMLAMDPDDRRLLTGSVPFLKGAR